MLLLFLFTRGLPSHHSVLCVTLPWWVELCIRFVFLPLILALQRSVFMWRQGGHVCRLRRSAVALDRAWNNYKFFSLSGIFCQDDENGTPYIWTIRNQMSTSFDLLLTSGVGHWLLVLVIRVYFLLFRYIWFYCMIHFNFTYIGQSLLFTAITTCMYVISSQLYISHLHNMLP